MLLQTNNACLSAQPSQNQHEARLEECNVSGRACPLPPAESQHRGIAVAKVTWISYAYGVGLSHFVDGLLHCHSQGRAAHAIAAKADCRHSACGTVTEPLQRVPKLMTFGCPGASPDTTLELRENATRPLAESPKPAWSEAASMSGTGSSGPCPF